MSAKLDVSMNEEYRDNVGESEPAVAGQAAVVVPAHHGEHRGCENENVAGRVRPEPEKPIRHPRRIVEYVILVRSHRLFRYEELAPLECQNCAPSCIDIQR